MQTKLTLRMEERLIKQAKAHARRLDKSVSQMVAEYFGALGQPEKSTPTLPPRVARLKGSLKSSSSSIDDYRRHLEKKYR